MPATSGEGAIPLQLYGTRTAALASRGSCHVMVVSDRYGAQTGYPSRRVRSTNAFREPLGLTSVTSVKYIC